MADKTVKGPYRVSVRREDNWWLADVLNVPGAHTHAKTVSTLTRNVREVIVLMANLPADSVATIPVQLEFRLPAELERILLEVQSARDDSEAAKTRAMSATLDAIAAVQAAIPDAGVRDIAAILGLSHQRIHQLLSEAS